MADQQNQKDVVVNMDDLTGIIAEAVKGMDLPQIKALQDEINEVHRKAIFPSGEGSIFETVGKSIVDTSFFTKSYMRHSGPGSRGAPMGGVELAHQLKASGGPFLSLSPVMDQFATIMRCRGDAHAAESFGVNIKEYNEAVKEETRKVFGEKALTTTDAGALVPVEYMATVMEFATAQSAVLGRVFRVPMSSMILKIPKLVQAAGSYFGGLVLYHPNEGGQKTATKPTFDQLTFTAKKLIGLCPITDELIMDSNIAILNYVTALFTRAFQYTTEGEVIAGTGANNQMTGILADSSVILNAVSRQTAGTVKYDDLINLESALDENFQDLTFLSRRATVNTFRKQKVTPGTNDQLVFTDGYQTALGMPMPPQLMGYPLVKTRNVPAMGMRGDVILGDLGFYVWAVRQDMTIDTSKEYRFDYDETTLRFVIRQDGAPGVSEAFAILDGSES